MSSDFPVFDQAVPDDGYVWWYIDAISDDNEHALTIIAMLGSVFSPYYARARRKGPTNPLEHCAMNVVLYGKSGKRWAMTERTGSAIKREAHSMMIGPSSIHWQDDVLTVDINETAVPVPKPLRGKVHIYPSTLVDHTEQLDANGRHWWRPLAPCSRAEIKLDKPDLKWKGHAYLDFNKGSAPLESDFQYWDWSRAKLSNQTAILYDVTSREQQRLKLAITIDANGNMDKFTPAEFTPLPVTGWRVNRATHSDAAQASIVKTLEDTPFYSRSLMSTSIKGESAIAMHESLSLDRFKSRWVQTLLPFRMPRIKSKH